MSQIFNFTFQQKNTNFCSEYKDKVKKAYRQKFADSKNQLPSPILSYSFLSSYIFFKWQGLLLFY